MKHLKLTLFTSIFLLFGCSSTITSAEAEQIALYTATEEGYKNPRLFTEFQTETNSGYQYSMKAEKDLKVWIVTLLTDDRIYQDGHLGDVIYYIDQKNGEIVHKVSGVEHPKN